MGIGLSTSATSEEAIVKSLAMNWHTPNEKDRKSGGKYSMFTKKQIWKAHDTPAFINKIHVVTTQFSRVNISGTATISATKGKKLFLQRYAPMKMCLTLNFL